MGVAQSRGQRTLLGLGESADRAKQKRVRRRDRSRGRGGNRSCPLKLAPLRPHLVLSKYVSEVGRRAR